MKTTPTNMDEYIAGFPETTRQVLEKVRATIRAAAPAASEAIKYGIPTFTLQGNMISFAAYKNHVGIYPAPQGDESFQGEIAPYLREKSTIRFPLDAPIPYDLITRIVKFRMADFLARSKSRTYKK